MRVHSMRSVRPNLGGKSSESELIAQGLKPSVEKQSVSLTWKQFLFKLPRLYVNKGTYEISPKKPYAMAPMIPIGSLVLGRESGHQANKIFRMLTFRSQR